MAFFSLKISDPNSVELVRNIKSGGEDIEILQLNQLEDDLRVGSYVFIQLGGDRVTWEKGLIGLASIIREPYAKGYDPGNPRNFKLGLKMILVLNSVIKRSSFRFYPDAYDAGGIGPNTKGEQNQAIKTLTDRQAHTIIRAMVDYQPSLEDKIRMLFPPEICDKIFGRILFLFEDTIDHKSYVESKRCTFKEYSEITPEQREKKYCDWVVCQKKNDTEYYTPKTAYNYSQSLKNDAKKMIGLAVDEKNLFAYIDVKEYDSIIDMIHQCENYDRFNKDSHYTFNNAISTYRDFLLSLSSDVNRKDIAKNGYNKIYYGAPGCGKSRYVKDMLNELKVPDKNIFRVTFHPEYMNCDFVGQVLPRIDYEIDRETGEKKEIVTYKYNPGPFTLALERACETTDMVYLVIEEINRGNAASIFGDVFQLLDRVKDMDADNYGCSEFSIRNTGVQDYLLNIEDKQLLIEEITQKIYIPSNLTLLATMNSSDQNVFTMDTAFKRRWLFEQISNDIEKDAKHPYKNWYVPGTDITWQTFLVKINEEILNYKIHNQTNEDKRLGKYFVGKECLTEAVSHSADVITVSENFAYKVFEYIWNDVCKIGRDDWFDQDKYKTLEDVIDAFVNTPSGEDPLRVFRNINFRE